MVYHFNIVLLNFLFKIIDMGTKANVIETNIIKVLFVVFCLLCLLAVNL